jgi:hypothetical protein
MMKKIIYRSSIILLALSFFITIKMKGQNAVYKILFIQPDAQNDYSKWLQTKEKEIDRSNCNVGYSAHQCSSRFLLQNQRIKEDVGNYRFWIWKTITKNESTQLVTIKYELEDKSASATIRAKQVLGVFRGYKESQFIEWFDKSIKFYAAKLLKNGPIDITPVKIGQMAKNLDDISNAPNNLNLNLLRYIIDNKAGMSSITIQLDDELLSQGDICINLDKINTKKKTMQLVVSLNNHRESNIPLITLEPESAYQSTLKSATDKLAKIIADYIKINK